MSPFTPGGRAALARLGVLGINVPQGLRPPKRSTRLSADEVNKDAGDGADQPIPPSRPALPSLDDARRRREAACGSRARERRVNEVVRGDMLHRQPFGPNQVTTGQKSLAGRGRPEL
jgi:hypothetical protein